LAWPNCCAHLALPESRYSAILKQIDTWPVQHASAGVISSNGSQITQGDSGRVYRLASLSKPLTAWACLIAVEEGSVGLDDPIGTAGATLRHCLSHAAGYGFDSVEPITPIERRRIYSNTGIERAADHVATRTGLAFATYLHEAIFEPLAMTSSRLDGSPAHQIFSSLNDMLIFASEVLCPALISAETANDALSIQFPSLAGMVPGVGSFTPNPWGLGFEIHGHKFPHWMGTTNSPSAVGHFGGSGTMMWIDRTFDIALVALTDRDFDQWSGEAIAAWSLLSDAVITTSNNRS